MTNFGEIVNISSRIQSLEAHIEELKKLDSQGTGFAILLPSRVSPPSTEGLPMYTSKYVAVKLLNKVKAYYKDEWSRKPVVVCLTMFEPPMFNAQASGWLSRVECIKFISTDGEYIYVKTDSCNRWTRVGQIYRRKA